ATDPVECAPPARCGRCPRSRRGATRIGCRVSRSSGRAPGMQASVRAIKGGLMLYDAAESGKIHDHVFAPAYWRARNALSEPLGGRGAAWRITAGDIDWVLR